LRAERPRPLTAALLLLAGASLTAAPPTLSVDDILALRRVLAVQIAPGGAQVAYVVDEPNGEAQSKAPSRTSLWLAPAAGGQAQRQAAQFSSPASPQWSPDSRRLGFLAEGQLHVLEVPAGHVLQVTRHGGAVASYHWAPDGRRLAFVAPRAEAPASEQRRRLELGYDAHELHPSEPWPVRAPNGVWIADVPDVGAEPRARAIDIGALHVMAARWSPDGVRLLLTVADRPWPDEEQLRPRLVAVDLAGGRPQLYCRTVGKLAGADWSPDGKGIVFLGSVFEDTDFFPGGLFLCAGPGSAPANLIAKSRFTVENFRWMRDGKLLAIIAQDTNRYLATLDPKHPQPRRVTGPGRQVQFRTDYSAARDGRIACVLARHNVPPDVWLLESGGARQITHLNPQLEQRSYGEGAEVRWRARDGLEITGVLITPPGHRAGARVPMITHLHGSNIGEVNDFQMGMSHWGQWLAAQGWAVLMVNYRGSLTNGSDFMHAFESDLGGKDMQDILDGVQAMVDRGVADPERLGISGVSYGGYLTLRTITQSPRFRAAAVLSGISDYYGMHTGATLAPESAGRLEWLRSPFEISDFIRDRSPLTHVGKAKTATLLLWGEFDTIPLMQAQQFHRGLAHFGVPAKLVVYPREGHGLREPNHLRDGYQRVAAWFRRYL